MYIKITGYDLQVFSLGSYLYRLFLDFPGEASWNFKNFGYVNWKTLPSVENKIYIISSPLGKK